MNRWATERQHACRDKIGGVWSERTSDQRVACLRRGRQVLADIGQQVASATAEKLEGLQLAIVSMTDPSRCGDDALISSRESPPVALALPIEEVRDQLERARSRIDAGRYEDAEHIAAEAIATARALQYGPLLAEALLVDGHARMRLDATAAVAVLREAAITAINAGLPGIAIEASARWAWVHGTSGAGDPLAGLDLSLVQGVAERTPSADFERALLYNNLGSVAIQNDERDKARDYLQRALSFASHVDGRLDRRRLELLAIPANLGLVTNDRAEADKLLADSARETIELLGEIHTRAQEVQWMRGTNTLERLAEVVAFLSPLCEISERYPPTRARVGRCWVEVGYLYLDLDRPIDARAAFGRALHGSVKPSRAAIAHAALFQQNDPHTAAAEFTRLIDDSLAGLSDRSAERSWDQVSRAELLLGLGHALRAQGKLRDARATLEASRALLVSVVKAHPSARYERLLARVEIQLAQVLASLHVPKDQIQAVAVAAVTWLRKVGGNEKQIIELSRWLD